MKLAFMNAPFKACLLFFENLKYILSMCHKLVTCECFVNVQKKKVHKVHFHFAYNKVNLLVYF